MHTKMKYTKELINIMVNEVNSGTAYTEVAKKYGVPNSTLHTWLANINKASNATKESDKFSDIAMRLDVIELKIEELIKLFK